MEVAIAAGVLGFWVFFVWRVKVERGWVGVDGARRLQLLITAWCVRSNAAMQEFALAFGRAMAPAVEKATKAIRAWGEAYERALAVAREEEE